MTIEGRGSDDGLDVAAAAMSRRHAGEMGVAAAASTAGSIPVLLVGALAVQMRTSLHLGVTGLGLAVSVYYLTAAVSSIPVGRLTDALGGGQMMCIAAVLAALSMELMGFAAGSWASLAAALAVAGVAGAAMPPASNLFLLQRIPSNSLGLAIGVKQAAVPMATVLGGIAVPAVGLTIGWRWAFVMAAGLAFVAAALVPRGRRASGRPDAAGHPVGSAAPLLSLVLLSVGLGCAAFAGLGVSVFLVVSAVATGIGKADAGLVAALAGGAAAAARVTVGVLADRRRGEPLVIMAGMLACGVVGYLGLSLGSETRMGVVYAVSAVVAFGAGWGWNGLLNLAVVQVNSQAPGRATGLVQIGGRIAGIVSPALLGLTVVHASYAGAWLVAAVMALIGAVAVLSGRRLLSGSAARAAGLAAAGMATVPRQVGDRDGR